MQGQKQRDLGPLAHGACCFGLTELAQKGKRPCVFKVRSVAQSGSAPASGAGGRRFESSHSDQILNILISLLIYKELGKGGKSLFLPQSIARTEFAGADPNISQL